MFLKKISQQAYPYLIKFPETTLNLTLIELAKIDSLKTLESKEHDNYLGFFLKVAQVPFKEQFLSMILDYYSETLRLLPEIIVRSKTRERDYQSKNIISEERNLEANRVARSKKVLHLMKQQLESECSRIWCSGCSSGDLGPLYEDCYNLYTRVDSFLSAKN